MDHQRQATNSFRRNTFSYLQKTPLLTALIVLSLLLLSVNVSTKSAAKTHHKLKRVSSSVRVQGCYFVYIYPGKVPWEEAENLIQELEELDKDVANYPNFSVQIIGKMQKLIYGFAAKLSPEALEYVLNSTIVSFVEEDQIVQIGQDQSDQSTSTPPPIDQDQSNQTASSSPQFISRTVTSWGIDRIDQVDRVPLNHRYNPPCNLTGKGVDVYVLDTGIYYNHDHFQDRAIFSGCDMIDELTVTDPADRQHGADCHGHGTAVAGVVGGTKNGVAPGVNLLAVRVMNCEGAANVSSVIKGLECVYNRTRYRNNPAVIHLSIYGAKNLAIKRAIDNLVKHGITVVGLSGNSAKSKSGNSCKVSPASIHGVISVAATTSDDQASVRSNLGQCVDILAPGMGIRTASYRQSNLQCTSCENYISGTSLAAPHVTGAVALLLEKCPRIRPWEVKHHLLRSMTLVNKVKMDMIPRRLRVKTPNLLLHVGPSVCAIEC